MDSRKTVSSAVTKLNRLMIDYVKAIRRDLGTTSPDDTALDVENEKLSARLAFDDDMLSKPLG